MSLRSLAPLTLFLCLQGPSAWAAKLTIGKPAPAFTLKDTKGKTWTLSKLKGKTVVLEWTSNTCPFVLDHYEKGTMTKLEKEYRKKNVVWLAIDSTHSNNAGKSTNWMAQWGVTFPTLLDPSGTVGQSYGARTTPHMYIIDPKGVLVYQGAVDSGADRSAAKYRNHVDSALTELLAKKKVSVPDTKPYGCSVKYLQF